MRPVLLLLLVPVIATAQCTPPSSRTWIRFADNGTCVDTLWFGRDYTATYGLDTALCERELPPISPSGTCDLRFVNLPGRESWEPPAGMGFGFKQDYRRSYSYVQVDTFRIRFQTGGGGFPVTFRWSAQRVSLLCDSASLQDEFGGFLVKARMHLVDSVRVMNPSFYSLFVILFGQGIHEDITQPVDELPVSFSLSQNYPNPFNPTTTIRFDIPERSFASIRICDQLGRQVSLLAQEVKDPGRYELVFDGSALATGVYYCRLIVGNSAYTRKLLLQR